jgi:hypothetical protein
MEPTTMTSEKELEGALVEALANDPTFAPLTLASTKETLNREMEKQRMSMQLDRTIPRPSVPPKQTSVGHLEKAVDDLRAAVAEVLQLGSTLIGGNDKDVGRIGSFDGETRPIVGSLHIIADDVQKLADVIKAEINRIRAGL